MRSLKKMYMQKIPAFTLPELVIALLLMAILFGVIATVYMIFFRQSGYYFGTNRFFTEYYITKKVLQRDFQEAHSIRLDPQQTKMSLRTKKGPHIEHITYYLDTGFIVRTTPDRADTFRPGALTVAQSMVNDSTPLLASLQLRHRYHTRYFYTYLQKQYAVADILNDSTSKEP